MQQCLYLIGAFGIPLFFMVNGYLLYNKEYTLSYLKKKLFHYGRFLISWCLIIGIMASIKDRNLVSGVRVFTRVFVGDGWLFHFWFIITLMIIHSAYWAMYSLMKYYGISIDIAIPWWLPAAFVLMMNVIFMFDVFYLMPNQSLVAIVPIPYRMIRYLGYFVLGLFFGKMKQRNHRCPLPNWFLFLIAAISFIALCASLMIINIASVWSTSTFYPSFFCTLGTTAIFTLCMNQTVNNRKRFWNVVRDLAPTTIGIWALHPFVRTFLKKVLALTGIELTLLLRILMVPVVLAGCIMVSKIALKIKGVRKLFQI